MLVKSCKGWRICTHKKSELLFFNLEFILFWKLDSEGSPDHHSWLGLIAKALYSIQMLWGTKRSRLISTVF